MQKRMIILCASLFVIAGCFSSAKAQCKDPWINQGINEIVGRAPLGKQNSGECDIKRYGNGSWSDYADLKRKIWARFAAEIASTYEDDSTRRLCLDTQSRNPGSKIVAWNCHGGESQQFVVRADGTIRIFNDGLCLDGRNGNGRDLIFDRCNGSRTQLWYVNRLPNGDNIPKTIAESDSRRFEVAPGQIQNQQNSSCIDIKGGSLDSKEIVLWQCHQGQINRGWNQMFGSSPVVPSGKAIVFLRFYQPAYQGHTGWAFRLADGRWVAGSQDGFSTPIIDKGKDNGWNMMIFEDIVDPITKMVQVTAEQQMFDYYGGNSVRGQNPEVMRFSPYTSYKAFDIYNAHPATAIQVAVRSKDWGYGVFRNNCVDQTVKILRAYGVSLNHPGEKGTGISPNTWFEQINNAKQISLNYNKKRARDSGCVLGCL